MIVGWRMTDGKQTDENYYKKGYIKLTNYKKI